MFTLVQSVHVSHFNIYGYMMVGTTTFWVWTGYVHNRFLFMKVGTLGKLIIILRKRWQKILVKFRPEDLLSSRILL